MFWRRLRKKNQMMLEMGAAKFGLLSDPHLAGFWMNEPQWAETNRFVPTAFFFYGPIFLYELHLGRDPESDKPAVRLEGFTYILDRDKIIVIPFEQPANDTEPVTHEGRWRFDGDGKLWLEMGGIWTPLIPATLAAMEGRGFPRESLDRVMRRIQVARKRYVVLYRPALRSRQS